jgi:hypothetical protein
VTDIEMASVEGGTVTLHDARRKVRWSVELEPFEIGMYPVTQGSSPNCSVRPRRIPGGRRRA